MRVCIVVQAPFPSIGGFENVVYDLARCLGTRMDVHVVSSGTTTVRPVPPGVTVYPILVTSGLRYVGTMVSFFVNIVRVWKHLRLHRPDVVHAHPSYPAGVVSLSAKALNIPFVVTSHGDDVQVDRKIGYGIRLNAFKRMLLRYVLRSVDAHTVVSESMVRDSIEAGSSSGKISVIGNGVDTRAIAAMRVDRTSSLEGTDGSPTVLYLGRLHPKKRPAELLRAFPEILAAVPSAVLVYAGRGEEEPNLRRLASALDVEGRVRFMGFVPEEEKWMLLHSCDVFVLPSSVEAFGVALIEAMACGRAVVASNVPPFDEIVRNGVTGILCNVEDSSEMAAAISGLLADSAQRTRLGAAAALDVQQRFDVDVVAEAYIGVYNAVMASRSRPPPG